MPPTATAELFNGLYASTTAQKMSESTKRNRQDVTDDTDNDAKKKRRDEKQQNEDED